MRTNCAEERIFSGRIQFNLLRDGPNQCGVGRTISRMGELSWIQGNRQGAASIFLKTKPQSWHIQRRLRGGKKLAEGWWKMDPFRRRTTPKNRRAVKGIWGIPPPDDQNLQACQPSG